MGTGCGAQTHLLVRGDVRPAGLVFEYAGSALDEAGFDAGIADPFADFFFVHLGDLVRPAAEVHVELKVGAAQVFFVQAGSADHPHARLARRLGHELDVATQVGGARVHKGVHAMGLEFLQAIDAEFERLVTLEPLDGDTVRFPPGPGDQQVLVYQGSAQFLRGAGAGDGVDLEHTSLLFSGLSTED